MALLVCVLGGVARGVGSVASGAQIEAGCGRNSCEHVGSKKTES